MSTTAQPAVAISDRDAVLRQLREGLAGQAEGGVRRAEVAVTGLNLLDWLAAQPPQSRGYWRDRDSAFELAGVGRADMLTGEGATDYAGLTEELHRRLDSTDAALRYVGGMAFMPGADAGPEWRPFRSYRFILPRFEAVCREGRTVLACNLRAGETVGDVALELERLVLDPGPRQPSSLRPAHREEVPSRSQWSEHVDAVTASFAPGRFEKVVLARRVTLQFGEALDAARLLQGLRAVTRDRFHFCFQPVPGSAFLGGSPERLYRRDGRRLQTEAVAGTRPRGANPTDDAALRAGLLADEKERREQAYVADGIQRVLAPLCTELTADPEPTVLVLDRGHHLLTRFRGELAAHVRDGDLLDALHPTAAVGGVPTARALREIAEREGFGRGWYAAPVGWISREAAQFAVGIRSALIENNRMHLYSGAGIVTGSTPSEEWNELENKLGDFLAILDRT